MNNKIVKIDFFIVKLQITSLLVSLILKIFYNVNISKYTAIVNVILMIVVLYNSYLLMKEE